MGDDTERAQRQKHKSNGEHDGNKRHVVFRITSLHFGDPVVEPVFADHPKQNQEYRKQPKVLDEPQRSDAAERPDEIHDKSGDIVEDTLTASHGRVEIACHPMEDEQAYRCRHQQLKSTAFDELLDNLRVRLLMNCLRVCFSKA